MIQPIFKHMELECNCGSTCIRNAQEVLSKAKESFVPCHQCPTINLKKFKPLNQQIDLKNIDHNFGRCECGKRHLDLVIAHVLKIMIEEGQKNENANLRNACVPLITPAYPLQSIPYLGEKSLIVLSPKMNKRCAERILDEVMEVKCILKGETQTTVGIKDSSYSSNVYERLAGCCMRCDIVNTPRGPMCIYKDQSKIHIEFPRPQSPKITALSMFLNKNFSAALKKYQNSENIKINSNFSTKNHSPDYALNSDSDSSFTVLDATCGPGTLGIFSLMAGAHKVVFNDLWKPATNMAALNLETNGFKVNFFDKTLENCMVASGDKFEVYNLDIRDLNDVLDEKFDICIIDPFPGVDSKNFIKAAEKLAKNVLVIE
jgi:hypothetical protein